MVEEVEGGSEGGGPGGRRGRMEVTVTLTRVTVGQHVDCRPLH